MRKQSAKKATSWKRELLSWVLTIGCGLLLALAIRSFLLVNATVLTGSMETTIMAGDRVFGNRLSYLAKDPQRYDIVIFLFPDDESERFVKRVIGLPGETVEIKRGKVYIDGSPAPLPDDFTSSSHRGDFGPYEVPEGHYFMLGDNRGNSMDSKNWDNAYVAREKILGKLFCVYYPSPRFLSAYEAPAEE